MSDTKSPRGRRQLLAALTDHGPASRVDLVRRTGLSSSAVSKLTRDLIDDSLVEEVVEEGGEGVGEGLGEKADQGGSVEVVRRGRGRPAQLLRVRPPSGVVVGVDVGNTHVRVATGEVGGPVLTEEQVSLTGADSLERTLDLAAAMVRRVVARAGREEAEVRLAVLGLPAPLEHPTGTVADNNILPAWIGHRPGEGLSRRLGVEVVVENDANLGAVGEQRAGAGRGVDSLIYVKFSTGIGAGLVLGGQLFRGIGGTAGEVGHVQVDPVGVLCRCGARGCLETVVSLPRLVAALSPVTDPDLDPAGFAALVAEGHAGAVRVVTDAGRTVGQTLASLVTVLNPELLVIGGRWTPLNELLAERIGAAVAEWTQPSAAGQVRVCAGTLAGRAEVLGAVAVAGEIVTRQEREAAYAG